MKMFINTKQGKVNVEHNGWALFQSVTILDVHKHKTGESRKC